MNHAENEAGRLVAEFFLFLRKALYVVKANGLRIRGLEIFVFRKIWRALFSLNIHSEIRPFNLLPATWITIKANCIKLLHC